MKQKSKTIFKVTFNHQEGEKFDMNNFTVHIPKGVSGVEMTYALTALLNVVLAHEEASGNHMSVDGFTNYLNILLKDTQIGIPGEADD